MPMRPTCYLDHNATTPLVPEAMVAMRGAMERCGNPSSVHSAGRHARRLVEDAREQVARVVGADPADVVFTSGGTEANVMALAGCGRSRVLVSAVEHPSVIRAIDAPEVVPVDTHGVVRLDALEAMLAASGEPALVSVMLANNETGVLQPVAQVSALARAYGAWVHCDAVQAPGRIVIDVRALGVHLLSLSAHKLGGPAGIGALVVSPDVTLRPLSRGGGQERGRRAGTENVIGIAGFGAAAQTSLSARPDRIARLRDGLDRDLRARCPEATIFGGDVPRLPNTTCVAMPGVDSEVQVIAFDLEGVGVSAGAACSSGKVSRSAVLQAMGVGEDIARTAIRVSLGWTTDEADVDRFLAVWTGIYQRASSRGPVWAQTSRVGALV